VNGKNLKIKVCGMKHQQNVDEIGALGLDFIGNIFFAKSPRNLNSIIHTSTTKVGVFVKESLVIIEKRITEHNLKVIQLHGGESNEFCRSVKNLGVQVWKVFSVGDDFESSKLKEFPDADVFLLDTKSIAYGGTGRKFDWRLLKEIDEKTPKKYFLAGGIHPNDAKEIKALQLENIIGLDLNSRFESSPGFKNVEELKTFLVELRS
jgi:phosphoribosylanthranilate isomerase